MKLSSEVRGARALRGSFKRSTTVCKRVVDVVGAVVAASFFVPVILVIAIRLSKENGDILYKHARLGRCARVFRVFKFRTMVPNSDAILRELLSNDPSSLQ